MITLYRFFPVWALPDLSPWCIKLELYLRMAGLPYTTQMGNMKKAPKGKIPYIEHEGRIICDSTAIVDYLESKATQPLDKNLSPQERAMSRAFQSMIEEHLYFVLAWQRWISEPGWTAVQPVMADFLVQSGVPSFLSGMVTKLIRRKITKTLYHQGTGRHSSQEIYAIGTGLLQALSDGLAEKPCLLGADAHTIDATLYGFLDCILGAPIEDSFKKMVQNQTNLMAYHARMKARYWATPWGRSLA
jgi:glutathione S-transferase